MHDKLLHKLPNRLLPPPHPILQRLPFFTLLLSIVFIFVYLLDSSAIFTYHRLYSHIKFSSKLKHDSSSFAQEFLINTNTCRLRDYPLFDPEIYPLFESHANDDYLCDKNVPPFTIKRVNFTWIKIDYPHRGHVTDIGWNCFASEIYRTAEQDSYDFGPPVGPLGTWNNFANNLTGKLNLTSETLRWDSVRVTCKQYPNSSIEFNRVVPLIQHYYPQSQNIVALTESQTEHISELIPGPIPEPIPESSPKVNIILLGIDSVSRLNFLRHMNLTRDFLESHNFIPLYGYHKVGENSFPNIMPMFTGQPSSTYYNDSTTPSDFRFDDVPLIFKNFSRKGYLTTFLEDMPPYGFFAWRGGFRLQPTDYYLRPTNMVIWEDLYYTYSCYQDKLEYQIYWDYILDLLEAFHQRGNQPHFTFAHLSTLTHNYFNHIGYIDKPYRLFLEQLFRQGSHKNTVILLYSDHALRFGDALNTTAAAYENRLPFFYVRIPDTLYLDGLNADQIRSVLRGNQHRLTSHMDLHATMMHVLNGEPPEDEIWSRSLFREIPANRTCESAGIPPQYCLCNSINPITIVTPALHNLSNYVVQHMNQLLSNYGNSCIPLTLLYTYRAFESYDAVSNHTYRQVHFETGPNSGAFEAMVRVHVHGEKIIPIGIEEITRINEYGSQSSCVAGKVDVIQFCYCVEEYEKDQKAKNKS